MLDSDQSSVTANIQNADGPLETLPSGPPPLDSLEPVNITSTLIVWEYILDQVVLRNVGDITYTTK